MKLSILVPVYNEEKTILKIIKRIKKVDIEKIEKEIIIVDDFSKDKTREILKKLKDNEIRVIFHEKNKGKGFAIRTALGHAKGDLVIIQDADFEYDPEEYRKLLSTLFNKKASVVYGSRFLNKNTFYWSLFYFGNYFLSLITSILYLQRITDMETCYKLFKREALNGINLECKRFDFEPEITAKFIKKGFRILEVPISYSPRTKGQGKKIKFSDGFSALKTLIKYKFMD